MRGVALVTALLIVAIATAAAVAMATSREIDVRRTANLLAADQALAHVAGAELWAVGVLREDARGEPVDGRRDAWTRPLPPTAVEAGEIAAQIEDLQGRFNLNNLWQEGAESAQDLARFRRLLALLKLDPALADCILDWIDPDMDARGPQGAEDDWYQRQQPPYRAANALFADVSELKLVRGVTAEVYATLRPHVTALPERTALNVNTAGPLLMQSLDERIDPALAEALVRSAPYGTPDAFATQQSLKDIGRILDVGVASQWFAVRTRARVDRMELHTVSLVRRASADDVRIVARTLAGEDDG